MRSQQEIETYIAELIEDVSLERHRSENIKSNQRLIEDLGLDSLDYAAVLLRCERRLGIKVPENDVDWRALSTVEEMAAYLRTRLLP